MLIYLDNDIIYNSDSNIEEFTLQKNKYYKLKLKLKNIPNNQNKHNTHLFLNLLGYYHNNYCLENNDIDFLYNIDNAFHNNVSFSNIINYKNIYFENNLNVEYINDINKIHINKKGENLSNNILEVYDSKENMCFKIDENNINIGNVINYDKLSKVNIQNSLNSDSIYIVGESKNLQDVNIKDDLNIKQNCIVNDSIKYNSINTNKLLVYNNIFNDDLVCTNLSTKNIFINYNNNEDIFGNLLIENIICNNKNYNTNNLTNNNVNILSKTINYNNKLLLNYEDNLNINSPESFECFSVGNKIKPNISVSFNGDTIINTNENDFYINNINIIREVNILKSNIY